MSKRSGMRRNYNKWKRDNVDRRYRRNQYEYYRNNWKPTLAIRLLVWSVLLLIAYAVLAM